jgi:NADH-quinone oxidoreductase subunit N
MMLLGFALLFSLSGTFDELPLAAKLAAAVSAPGAKAALLAASALVMAGVASRLSLFPWVMLRADLSEAASLPVAAWIQVGPAIAALALLVRFVRGVVSSAPHSADPANAAVWLPLAGTTWPVLLAASAIATTIIASIAALRATDLKRLFAWLTTAQCGFLALGVVAGGDRGLEAALFHCVAYAVTALGALATLALVIESAGSADFEVLRGLARRRGGAALVALALGVFMISLAGIWPTAGYAGRVGILTSLLRGGFAPLVAASAFGSLVGIVCCIRVIGTMFDRPADPEEPVAVDFEAGLLISLLLVATVGLGLWPAPLASFVARSVVFFGG